MTLTLVPAYGRDYKSKAAALADFDAEKDFRVCTVGHRYDGALVNKPQLVGQRVTLRFNKLRTAISVCVGEVE